MRVTDILDCEARLCCILSDFKTDRTTRHHLLPYSRVLRHDHTRRSRRRNRHRNWCRRCPRHINWRRNRCNTNSAHLDPSILQCQGHASQRLPHKIRHHKGLRLRPAIHQQVDLRRRYAARIGRGTLRHHLTRCGVWQIQLRQRSLIQSAPSHIQFSHPNRFRGVYLVLRQVLCRRQFKDIQSALDF